MKKTIALSILLFLFSSCAKEHPTIRFRFSHLSLTSYMWLLDEDTATRKNHWHLTIFSYIRIDSSGVYQISRRASYSDTLQYFKGVLPSSADSVLNTLARITQDTSYVEQGLKPYEIYDGPTECVIIERGQGSPTVIQYVPLLYPQESQKAYKLLQSLAGTSGGTATESFSFKPATDVIVRYERLRVFHGLPERLMRPPNFVTD